jgi:hypothetical protein
MDWESDPAGQRDEKDRTKFVWFGIIGLCGAMLLALWMGQGGHSSETRARVKHILIQYTPGDPTDRARAYAQVKEIKQWLVDGQRFESIAKDYSNDPLSSSRGGDLGWKKPGDLVDTVDEYVWNGELNQISDIITSGYGYHLVLVTDRTMSEAMQYERDLKRSMYDDDTPETQDGNDAP